MTRDGRRRVLLIGLGRWGTNHLRVLKSMPVELFVADHHQQLLSDSGLPKERWATNAQSVFSKID
ncbi:MAG: hypothetical protein IRY93_11670, partial [Chthoniobacterales bacterium]|nr:hypothetical protein [Chthoniobacterales bacterium]